MDVKSSGIIWFRSYSMWFEKRWLFLDNICKGKKHQNLNIGKCIEKRKSKLLFSIDYESIREGVVHQLGVSVYLKKR